MNTVLEDLLPTAPGSRAASSCSAASARASSRASSARRSSSTTSATLRAQARAYRDAAPGALVVYGTKAFPNVAVLRLLAEEGLGADVSTRRRARVRAARRHRRATARRSTATTRRTSCCAAPPTLGALIVLDSLEEIDRARAVGATRFLVRVTPGIEADTHEAVKTAHHGSKFGLPPDDALEALRRVPECEGLHVHVGSQLMHFGASLMTVDWVAQLRRARARRSSAGRRGSSTSAAASASPRARGAVVHDRRVRRRPGRRAAARLAAAGPAPAAADPRARAARSSRAPA